MSWVAAITWNLCVQDRTVRQQLTRNRTTAWRSKPEQSKIVPPGWTWRRRADGLVLLTLAHRERSEEMWPLCNNLRLRSLPTDEGGDLGVDDAAGKEVEVVLHRVHHHRVSRVVAALQRTVGTQMRHRDFRPVGVLLALRSEVKAFRCDSFLPLSRTAGRGFCTFTDRFAGLFLQPELVFLMPYWTAAVRLRHRLHMRRWLNFKPLITTVSLKHLQMDLSMCSDHAGYFWPFQ